MAFTKYKELKYATAGIPNENLTGFPKLFRITGDLDIASEIPASGGIKVTSADGSTELPIEVVTSWMNLSAGDVGFFVNLDLLSSASVGDTYCRLYYADGETTVEDHAGVWADDFVLVMHMEEDPTGSAPQMYDSVTESYIGTANGDPAQVSGSVGNAVEFDTNDYISITSYPTPSTVTLEAVTAGSGGNSPYTRIFETFDGGATSYNADIGLRLRSYDPYRCDYGQDASPDYVPGQVSGTTLVPTNGTASYVAATVTNGATQIFHNGSLEDSDTDSTGVLWTGTFGTVDEIRIGGQVFGDTRYVDELRMSSVVRSDDWIAYTDQDLLDNADTFTLGSEQTSGGDTPNPVRRHRTSVLLSSHEPTSEYVW